MLWTGIPQGRLFSMVGRMVHREPHSNEWLRMNFSTLPTPGMPLLPTGLLPTKSWLRFSSLLTVHRLAKPRHMLSGVAWAWWAVFIRMDPWAVEHQYLPYIPGSWELPVFCPAGHLVRRQSSSAWESACLAAKHRYPVSSRVHASQAPCVHWCASTVCW